MASSYISDRLIFVRDLCEHNTCNEHLLLIPFSHKNAMMRSFAYPTSSARNILLPLSSYEAGNVFNYCESVLHSSIVSTF